MLHCYFSKVQEMNINTNIYNVYALICKKTGKILVAVNCLTRTIK